MTNKSVNIKATGMASPPKLSVNKVMPMARAAIAAGADGLLIEVHPNPPKARSQGAQALFFNEFVELLDQVKQIASAIGRTV